MQVDASRKIEYDINWSIDSRFKFNHRHCRPQADNDYLTVSEVDLIQNLTVP